jgi:hypothetical protein
LLTHENTFDNNKGCVLENFKLVNRNEIIDFIKTNNGLLELIEKSYPLLEKYFPKYSYCLLYSIDPEILNLEHLMLFINGDEKFYDEDCLKLKDLERGIEKLKISNCNVKPLLLVDV